MSQEDLRIGRCKKFERMTCPVMDKSEMKKALRIFRQDESGESTGGLDPIACWTDLNEANDKFCIGCSQFEDLMDDPSLG